MSSEPSRPCKTCLPPPQLTPYSPFHRHPTCSSTYFRHLRAFALVVPCARNHSSRQPQGSREASTHGSHSSERLPFFKVPLFITILSLIFLQGNDCHLHPLSHNLNICPRKAGILACLVHGCVSSTWHRPGIQTFLHGRPKCHPHTRDQVLCPHSP